MNDQYRSLDKKIEKERYGSRAKVFLDNKNQKNVKVGSESIELYFSTPYKYYEKIIQDKVKPCYKVLEIGSGFGTSTSIINKFSSNIDCIESSMQMTEVFKNSIKDGLFNASLLDLTIEEFFNNKKPNIKKYQKIIINGSLDEEPINIIKNASDNAEIVCIIDNQDFKHKIVKYIKVGGKSNKLVIDEASSSYIYKYVQSEPFVF